MKDDMYREIKRMVDFFETRDYGAKVDKIYLIGGGSNIYEFDKYLTEHLDIETERFDFSRVGKSEADIDYNLLIPAIGAVLGGKHAKK